MKPKKRYLLLILTLFPLLLTLSCKGTGDDNNPPADSEIAVDDTSGATASATSPETGSAPFYAEDNENYTEPEPAPEPQTTAASKPTNPEPASYGRKETLYISGYGANGKVWGHVTMNGKTGRGTIHDEEENSLSITVTRHGGELYGTDQNGRQYVFQM